MRTVAGRLGHGGGGTTTLRVYAAWVAEADQRAAQDLADRPARSAPVVDEIERAKIDPRSPYERVAALQEIDLEESRDVADVLLGAGITGEVVASVLCRIHAARLHARTGDEVGLSARRYTKQRELILEELGLRSDRGAAVWSPTGQTVMKRLGAGSWADAQVAIGLTPDTRGRPRGLLAFTEDDYRDVVRQFLDDAAAAGQPATFRAYNRWVENEERAGRRWPSGASVVRHLVRGTYFSRPGTPVPPPQPKLQGVSSTR